MTPAYAKDPYAKILTQDPYAKTHTKDTYTKLQMHGAVDTSIGSGSSIKNRPIMALLSSLLSLLLTD